MQIKAKKKIGPSFALKNLAKTLFKVNLDDVFLMKIIF